MEYSDFFDEDGWLKDEYLWPLRQEITLGSMYVSDYNNSFGIKPEKVCDFFTSFWDGYCERLAKEDNIWEQAVVLAKERLAGEPNASESKIQSCQNDTYFELSLKKYDNEETLLEWYNCFDGECPLPPNYINVDIHWDFARSIRVIATSENEAISIVDDMMENKEIPINTFEPTSDYELDTDWQPQN